MKNFEARAFVGQKTKQLHSFLKSKKPLIAASGGIDSTVCALLAHKASPESLVVLFLDTGLMRADEPKQVTAFFAKNGIELQVWDVKEKFFDALKDRRDPEDKRKAFRDIFYRVLGQAIRSYSADVLIQGTILSDIIETQKGIKTQHNVLQQAGINPLAFGLQISEPLKELTKSQVRSVAKFIGVAPKTLNRWPFPGPGLATRIIGEVTPERIMTIRLATSIVEKDLQSPKIFQAFPVLFNDRVTGIDGDKRVFGEIIAIRAVESKDALTAKPYKLTWQKMEQIANHILKEVPGVVKVLFDVTPKPPSTIEYV